MVAASEGGGRNDFTSSGDMRTKRSGGGVFGFPDSLISLVRPEDRQKQATDRT